MHFCDLRLPTIPVLENDLVKLCPLDLNMVTAFQKVLAEDETMAQLNGREALWDLWYTIVPSPENVESEIIRRLDLYKQGSMMPFAVYMKTENQPDQLVGMTSFMNIDLNSNYVRVEIGSTWLVSKMHRTGVNTHQKYLMLQYAFEKWPNQEKSPMLAVEFRTHRLNRQSRAAIERLGAQLDAILRAHSVMANGTVRDTAVYSITQYEWPTVSCHLKSKMKH